MALASATDLRIRRFSALFAVLIHSMAVGYCGASARIKFDDEQFAALFNELQARGDKAKLNGIIDNVERLEKRIAFLRAHEKKMERIALIKAVHEERKKPRCSLCYILCPIAFSTDSCYHNFLDAKRS